MTRWQLPREVDLGDITVRDGLQTLEHFVPTDDKLRFAEDLILAGFKHIEVTNFGNPKTIPQFRDAEELLDRLFASERVGARLKQNGGDVTVTVVAINERAIIRALDYKARHGKGPDCLLQMVSTCENHHRVNSGMSLEDYWQMTERCTAMARAQGVAMCGTVSTIWGSPIAGHHQTRLETAVEFARRYLELGADYIEHADHDGSADPARVYEYFSMVLDPALMGRWADPRHHLAHFHTTRGMGLANYLGALQAGVVRYETTLSGIGGQPANVLDGTPVGGTGTYYHRSHLLSGLVGSEDFVTMLEGMGVQTGIDLDRLIETGTRFRDEVLRIRPEGLHTFLSNVAAATGISEARLQQLGEKPAELEALIAEASNRLAADKPLSTARATADALLRSTAWYLDTRHWAPSRAEVLMNGPLRRR